RISGDIGVHRSIANAIDAEIKKRRITGELVILKVFDCIVHRGINALQSTGDHIGMECMLVGVYPDTKDILLISSIKCTHATTASDLEDNISLVLVNLAHRHILTLGSRCEVIGIVDEDRDRGINLHRAVFVSSDIMIDRWNGLPTNSTDCIGTQQLRNL